MSMSDLESAGPNAADIVVVGAGPVGQILSLLLAARGRRVVLVERWSEPYALPRAVAASHDVRRVLDQLDLGKDLTDLFEPWDGTESGSSSRTPSVNPCRRPGSPS